MQSGNVLHQQGISPTRKEDSKDCTCRGKQNALGEQLAHQSSSRRSQRLANSNLLVSCSCSRQHQARNVGTSYEQHQSDYRHQNVQRFPELSPEVGRPFRAGSHCQRVFKKCFLSFSVIVLRKGPAKYRWRDHTKPCLQMFRSKAGFSAGYDLEPPPGAILYGGFSLKNLRSTDGNGHIVLRACVHAVKAGSGNADNGKSVMVERNCPPDSALVSAKVLLP